MVPTEVDGLTAGVFETVRQRLAEGGDDFFGVLGFGFQKVETARTRSAMALWAPPESGTKRSKPWGAPGWTWSSTGTPAFAKPAA